MVNERRFTRAALAAFAMMAATAAGIGAQVTPAGEDVTILNEHLATHQVFAVDAKGGIHLLGRVAAGELEDFDVPADVERLGAYRIALQEELPPPSIGVPATEAPFKATRPTLIPGGRMIVVVGMSTMSTAEVF